MLEIVHDEIRQARSVLVSCQICEVDDARHVQRAQIVVSNPETTSNGVTSRKLVVEILLGANHYPNITVAGGVAHFLSEDI